MDETQTLERYYISFIKQETPSNFFTSLTDYLEYMDSVPAFVRITKRLLEKGKPLEKKMNDASDKADISHN
jgi:hypothetical protein